MPKEKEYGSLDPETFTEGGGLLDDFNATFTNCRAEMFEFVKRGASSGTIIPCFVSDLELDDGETITQPWSVGFGSEWEPEKGGNRFIPIGDRKTFARDQDFAVLVQSMLDAGFPRDRLSYDMDIFNGYKVHFIRIPAPSEKKSKKKADKEYERRILTVDKSIRFPWEKESKGTTKKKEEPAEDDASTKASEAIMAILSDNPKGVEKMKLIGMVFTTLKKDGCKMELVNAATRLIRDESVEGPWRVEKGVYLM